MSVDQFVPRILESLAEGEIIRRVVAGALRVFAILGVVAGFAAIVAILKVTMGSGSSTESSVGGAGLGILVLVAVLVIAQILWCRSRSVEALGDSPFTVIPIVSILFRAMGEVYAAFAVLLGIGVALFSMVAGYSPSRMLGPFASFVPGSDAGGGFLGGVIVLLTAIVGAFAVLLFFYLLAELIVVLADIARNMRLLVAQSMRAPSSPPRV